MDMSRIEWRKSSYSTGNGGNCVEVGVWRKSSYSNSNGGACVEVGVGPQFVAVRDSKDPDGPALVFGAAEWDELLGQIKDARPGLA